MLQNIVLKKFELVSVVFFYCGNMVFQAASIIEPITLRNITN